MKIIFLEIHGVLMIPICEPVARLLNQPISAFQPAVDALNLITKETGAEIVITSVWRNAGLSVMVDRLRTWGVMVTPKDITPIAEGKSEEITRYLIWATKPDAYVIIDPELVADTRYDLLSLHVVRTDAERGLTEELARQAIAMLNGRTCDEGKRNTIHPTEPPFDPRQKENPDAASDYSTS